MSDINPALKLDGLLGLGSTTEASRETRIAEHLGDIAHFMGVPLADWNVDHWKAAALTAISGTIALERRLIALRLANALLHPPKRKRGRPRSLPREPKQPSPKKARRRIAFIEDISDELAKEHLDWADDYESDAAFCRAYVKAIADALDKDQPKRRQMLKDLEKALPKAISRYRSNFERPRPTT